MRKSFLFLSCPPCRPVSGFTIHLNSGRCGQEKKENKKSLTTQAPSGWQWNDSGTQYMRSWAASLHSLSASRRPAAGQFLVFDIFFVLSFDWSMTGNKFLSIYLLYECQSLETSQGQVQENMVSLPSSVSYFYSFTLDRSLSSIHSLYIICVTDLSM